MKLGTFLIVAACIYFLFGIGFYLAPALAGANFGMKLDSAGILQSRVLGSALIGFSVAFYFARNSPMSTGLRGLLWGACLYNVLDLPFLLGALADGTVNAMAWSAVVLHVALAAGFGYFAWSEPQQS